jgi:glycosyltransferase involved in cell wall biosynthesis
MSTGKQRDRVRVLLVGPSLRVLGGQAVQANNLLEGLRADGRVDAEMLPVNPLLPGPLRWLQQVKYLRTVATIPWYVATLVLRAPFYDVLHIFAASSWAFVLAPTPALIVARLFRRKSILNYRDGRAEDHLARWRTAALTLRLADRLVTPSGYLVDVFARFGLEAQYIHNFVDITRFRFRRRRPFRPVFLSNRGLEPLYNIGCILRAFALIQARYPDAQLLIAGGGSQRQGLEALGRELGLRDVEFLGPVPNSRMHELYDRADIYLNSPNVDNMPVSIIEAYASGLAVATTKAGGIPYIVRHEETGLLTPVGDSEALAESAIRFLREQDFTGRVVAQAREQCNQYTWDAVREQWISLYTELAGRG